MEKITCDDVLEFQDFLKLAPPFILKRMAKKNSNLVKKFEPQVRAYANNLDDNHKKKLDIVFSSDIVDLQGIMNEAYKRTNKKQFKILADPKYKEFIRLNLEELRKMI